MNWLKLLDRIGATPTRADLETLVHLQRQSLLALPFENLDIHLARVIRLDHDSLYRKIVAGDRGGFCYELNECFYQCLVAMGYMVERLEARVELGGPGGAFDHQCSLVHLDGARWLADIGFGDSSMRPLCLEHGDAQTDGQSWFSLTGNTLKEVGEQSVETAVAETEYVTVLAERFGMMLHDASWSNPLV